jgi:hypothetical protein
MEKPLAAGLWLMIVLDVVAVTSETTEESIKKNMMKKNLKSFYLNRAKNAND